MQYCDDWELLYVFGDIYGLLIKKSWLVRYFIDGGIIGWSLLGMYKSHKEKLVWFPLFIVDAINNGHENYFMSFWENICGLKGCVPHPPDPWSGGGYYSKRK
jgi:hypothetical protein